MTNKTTIPYVEPMTPERVDAVAKAFRAGEDKVLNVLKDMVDDDGFAYIYLPTVEEEVRKNRD